jgi:hypothetical protein
MAIPSFGKQQHSIQLITIQGEYYIELMQMSQSSAKATKF